MINQKEKLKLKLKQKPSACSCTSCQQTQEHHHHHEEEDCGCALCAPEPDKKEDDKTDPAEKIILSAKILLAGCVFLLVSLPGAPLWLISAFTGLAILIWGWELFWKGLKGLIKLRLDENSLMTIAVLAAFVLGEYSEALLVVVLFSLGELLEERAVRRSRKDIAAVINIRPQSANLLNEAGEITVIASSKIQPGDLLLVKVGEQIPVDCQVIEGESAVDQSALTGEAIAVGVQAGDTVLSGAVNLSKVLHCRASSGFEDSTASRIIKLVEESAAQKGQTEKLITRFAKIYTPIVVAAAIAVAFLPPLLGIGSFSVWVLRALVFLVASCPCALVISIPLAFYSGVGAISKQGVLVKGTKFLEPLSRVTELVFDKTGTITSGELTLSQIVESKPDSQLFALSALAESYSNHPVAQAITQAYRAQFGKEAELLQSDVSQAEESAGKGVRLLYRGQELLCGSARLLEEHQVPTSSLPKANVYTALDGVVLGYFILSDLPREEAASALVALKKLGVRKTILLTGDSQLSAQIVQEKVGIDEIHYDLLPQEKAKILTQRKAQGAVTAFVGDGINDAPVIAAADIGIAMGLGSDAAIESADAVLVSQNLFSLVTAIKTSRRCLGIVRFNIWFILLIKAAVLLLGILGITNMWMAVFADVGLSIIAVLNSVRILK